MTPSLVKKIITSLDSSMTSGPDCVPVLALKKCRLELSHILAELFIMRLHEFCFPDNWKVSSVAFAFKNVEGSTAAKNYRPVNIISPCG